MSRTPTTYKNYHGGYEELLTKENYELWAPIMKRELEGRDHWGFINGTRTAPDPLPPNSPAAEQLIFRTESREHRAEQSAAGIYIYNACSKFIKERYLCDLNVTKPKELWDKLKEKLQGNNDESRTKLLTKFMTMKKPSDMTVEQFTNKLKLIQKLLNGEGAAAVAFITDKMILEQIFNNAGESLKYLTNELRTTPNLVLGSVLKRYELAEDNINLNNTTPKDKDTVSGLASQQQQPPRAVNLPVCPANWNGIDCWFHSLPVSHRAIDCDALKEFQRPYLIGAGIQVKDATRLRGYPVPGLKPRYPGTMQYYPNNNSNSGGGATKVSPGNTPMKRVMCGLCSDIGHTVDLCPMLSQAANALKKIKTESAAIGQTDDFVDKDQVPAL